MEGDARDVKGRLVDLETKHSYQEAVILDISEAIVRQATRIDALEALVRSLREKIMDMSGEGQAPLPTDERPPHY
jgi:SlyX protein